MREVLKLVSISSSGPKFKIPTGILPCPAPDEMISRWPLLVETCLVSVVDVVLRNTQ